MSDANLQVGIESGQAVSGSRTVVRSINDIYSAASNLDTKLRSMESTFGKVGSNTGLTQAKQKMNELNSSGQDLKKLLVSIEDRFIRIGATAAGMWIVKQIFDSFAQPIVSSIKYLTEMESAGLGVASSLLVTGKYIDQVTNKAVQQQQALKFAQSESAAIMEQLKVANINTIATLDELIVAYQTALPVAMARGFDKKQVLDFTLAMVQAAGAIGLPFNQMSEEIRSLLTEGAINPRTSRIATVLGLRNEDLRKYKNDAQGLFDFLMGKLEGFTVAGQQSQNTMKGIWSNIIDVAKQLGGTAFEGVFTGLRTQLKSVLDSVVTFDSVAKKATWNKEWVDGAKNLNEWMTTTFNTLVSVTKTLIEHRDLILTVVQSYVAYQVISTLSAVASKLLSVSIANETTELIAKQVALARLGITESSALTIQQQSILASRESLLVAAQEATASATKQAARQAEVASINASAQAKIKEMAQSVENVQVRRWEIGLEQEAQAAKISGLRLNAELLVQERLLAESRVASASAYANASIAANGKAWSTEAIAIEKVERDLLSAAIGRETAARMALESTMIRLSGLEAEEISLKSGQVAAEQALLSAKARAIEVDSAATDAALRHNAALIKLGETAGFVTAASLAKVQTDWVYMGAKERAIALEIAHTEALAMNKMALQANALGHVELTAATVATTGASKALGVVWNLMGGWIGVIVIAIYGLYKAWESVIEIEKEYMKEKEKLDSETYVSKLKKETEAILQRNKAAKETPESKVKESQSTFATELENAKTALAEGEQNLKSFESRHKAVLDGIKTGDTVYKQLHREYKEINDEIDRNKKTMSDLPKVQKDYEKALAEQPQHIANPARPGKGEKDKKSESEKAMDRLINGYQQWQQIAIRTGKVEDELGAKILGHQNAVKSLMDDTAKAKGPQADAIRASIDALLAETIAIEKNLDAKKRRFEILDREEAKSKSNNADTLRSAQLLHAKGIIDDQQYLDAQLLSKQAEIDIQKRYLDQKLQVMQDLNINTKDKADLLLAIENNKNAGLAAIDNAGLARISDTNKKKALERQRELDDVKRKSEEYRSLLSLQVAKGDISSSDATWLGMQDELNTLGKQRASLEDKGFNDALSATELQQVIQELENVDTQITIVQNKAKSFAADQGWVEGIKRGFKQYADDAGNLGKQMESAVTNAMKGMEDALVNFVKTGKLNFKDLADSIITHMIRIMVQQTAMKAISGIGSSIMGMFGFANGGAFESGVQKFAKGGVVNSPTIFPMAKGMGLMGEAGPEAVMPLTRTASGKLGVEATSTSTDQDVSVVVNITNKGQGEVKQGSTNVQFDGKRFVINTIIEDVQNNGPLRGLMGGGGGY